MTSFQKIVKYGAIAFAALLAVNIVFGIIWGVGSLAGFLGLNNNENIMDDMKTIITDNTSFQELEIKLGFTSLEIKEGTEFKVETNNSKIEYENKNGKVTIKEKTGFFVLHNSKISNLVIYIPSDMNYLNKIDIEAGAGTIYISNLKTDEFNFDQGAGKVYIENLTVLKDANIDGGAGKMEIISSNFNNIDLDLGAGEFILEAILTGTNEIDSGVGSVRISLLDGIDNYTIKASKGLGSIKIDGKGITNNITYGNGSTFLQVYGGVGSITID